MSIFVDMTKQVKWEDGIEDFAIMVNDKYKEEVLTAELEGKERIIIDWEDVPMDIQSFLMQVLGEQLEQCIQDMEYHLTLDTNIPLKIGFKNFPDMIDIDRCSQNDYFFKLVQIEGMIGSISAPLSYTSKIIWQCTNCNSHHNVSYDFYDRANPQNYCPECKRRTYNEIEHQVKTDFQIIEVVRPIAIVGRTPESLRIILKGDLVEFGDIIEEDRKLIAGNKIKVIGINKDFPAYRGSVRRKPYIDCINWFVEKEYLKLNKNDIKEIKKLAKRNNLIEDLIDSVAPSLVGLRDIKLAILLMAVGGVSKIREDKTLKRGTLHCLLVGDPSLGKTQLGRWVTEHIVKSRYVVASSLSKVGLGASLQRDEKLGYWYINAGALLLSNNSIAIIDEADKADGDDLNQLDMVMENEMLTITKIKAGSFPARTSILALANPKYSRFDPYINISEQIKMESQTYSRYDLKFAIKDIVNPENDEKIISSKFTKMKSKIDSNLLVKYLYYAKRLEPELTEECRDKIVGFYKELREKTQGQGGAVAITPRQGDTIIRLSEAFAKLHLRETITPEDVERAINIMKSYLRTFGFDMATGMIDADLAERGKPKSKRDIFLRVLEIIRELSAGKDEMVSEEKIINRCEEEEIDKDFVFREAIPELRKSGDIYSPKFHYWAVIR